MAQVVGAMQIEVVESPHLRRLYRSPLSGAVFSDGRDHAGRSQLAQGRLDRRGPQLGPRCGEALLELREGLGSVLAERPQNPPGGRRKLAGGISETVHRALVDVPE